MRTNKVETRTNKKISKELKQYIVEIKKANVCQICGESRWYVLDFHHLGDKDYEISDLLRFGSKKLLIKELNKCIPLCANCHREVHYLERCGNSDGRVLR